MGTNRSLLAVTVGLLGSIVLIWFSTSLQGNQKTYELRPQLTIPQYRTDVARVVDAYERLMDRYMDLTEMNLTTIGTDLKITAKKLDSIDAKLAELSARTARIEQALGIEQRPEPPASAETNLSLWKGGRIEIDK